MTARPPERPTDPQSRRSKASAAASGPGSANDPSAKQAAGADRGSTPGPAREDEAWLDTLDASGADDAVIGRALRRSALGLLGAGLVLGLLWFARRGDPEPAVEVAIPTSAPQAVVERAAAPDVTWTDVTAESGIDVRHVNGAAGDKLLPETMGGGVALFDVDGDADLDLLLVNGAPWSSVEVPGWRQSAGGAENDESEAVDASDATDAPTTDLDARSRLFLNDGSGRFSDGTDAHPGLQRPLYGMGVAVGDFDGDGRDDVFLSAVGRNRLLRNSAEGLIDVTEAMGVAGDEDGWSTGAAFLDYDRDGDLDLFVTDYVVWSPALDFEIDYQLTGVGRAYGQPQNYEGTHPTLWRNDGPEGFKDVSEEAGLYVDNPATGGPVSKGLGVVALDFDQDGWQDVFVANDTVRNVLYRNTGDGRFEEVAQRWGVAYDRNGNATGAMGVDVAAHRNDEALGVAIGNFANEMTSLYVSQGARSMFADEAIGEGIGAPSRLALTFGLFFFDYDLDGRLDLLQANGHLEEQIAQVDPSQAYRQPAQLFWNAGAELGFEPVSEVGDLATPIAGRGATYGDLDGDGDLDVVLTQVGGSPLLLRNDQALGNHWLRVRLEGSPGEDGAPAAPVLGARITLEAGGQTQVRDVVTSRSYLSQTPLAVTFGLGAAERADAVHVLWPDGLEQSVQPEGVDREMVIRRDDR